MLIRIEVSDCIYGDVVMIIDREFNTANERSAIRRAKAYAEKYDLEDYQVITAAYRVLRKGETK